MKTGKTLQELAAELDRQQNAKFDFVAPTKSLRFETADNGESYVSAKIGNQEETFPVGTIAHDQLATHLDIPRKYYDRLRTNAPKLLDENVNHWLRSGGDRRMVRTLDKRIRAFMSDRYRPMDNYDLATAVLPVLGELKVQVHSAELTERKMYLKCVDERITKDIPKGNSLGDGSHVLFDTLSPAIVISNSEVGFGALAVETALWTRACTNLAIMKQQSMRKYHVGSKFEGESDEVYAMLTDETRRQNDKALWLKARDIVRASFDRAKFDASVARVKGMTDDKIEADVIQVIEKAAEKFGLNDSEKSSVLSHLIKGGDLSRYGLFNAVTRTAEDIEDYDRATDFEKLGGEIIELPKSEWTSIAA